MGLSLCSKPKVISKYGLISAPKDQQQCLAKPIFIFNKTRLHWTPSISKQGRCYMLRAVMCRNTAVKKSGTQKTPNKFHLKKYNYFQKWEKSGRLLIYILEIIKGYHCLDARIVKRHDERIRAQKKLHYWDGKCYFYVKIQMERVNTLFNAENENHFV